MLNDQRNFEGLPAVPEDQTNEDIQVEQNWSAINYRLNLEEF